MDMNNKALYFLTCLTSICLFIVTIFMSATINNQDERIRKLERLACAFVQYEDGSVRLQTDDYYRFTCMGISFEDLPDK